jgi:dihydrodipicolinate synthase/N-acetylneuraminate lyase
MLSFLEQYPATAVLILPPYYIKPVSSEGLKLFYEPAIAATRHPVIIYHIPKYAVPVPTEVVTDLPVWGVKDSRGEPGYAEALLSADKGVLLGTEDDLWERLNLGAQGAISALANFIPEQIVEMYRKVKAGDEEDGRALSERLKRVRAGTKEYTSAAVLKKLAQARHGGSMGTVRPPLTPAPAGRVSETARSGGRRAHKTPSCHAVSTSSTLRVSGDRTTPWARMGNRRLELLLPYVSRRSFVPSLSSQRS